MAGGQHSIICYHVTDDEDQILSKIRCKFY